MVIKRTTPLRPALSAAEVRSHLRQIDAHEAGLIDGYLLASQHDIEIQCERAITVAKYRLTLPRFPGGTSACGTRLAFDTDQRQYTTDGSAIQLQMCPVLAVAAITYFDESNDLQTYADFVLAADEEPGLVRQALGTYWPATYRRNDAVTITFWAGSIVPLSFSAATGLFTSITGYEFADDDEVVISKSGNSNKAIGDIAAVPDGVEENRTYYVVSADGATFEIAETIGGAAVSLDNPSVGGQSVDLLFAGQIEPYHRLALLQMAAKAFGERCPQGGCVCSADDFDSNPMLRRLKWRSPVEFVG